MSETAPTTPMTLEDRLPSLSFAVWGAAICIFVAALRLAQDVVIPIVGAAVMAVVLTPFARFLMRRFMFPTSLAAFAAFILAFVVILSLLFVAVPTVQRLSEDFPSLVYRVEYKLRSIALSMEAVKRWSETVEGLISLGQKSDGNHVLVREGGGAVGQLISSTPKVIAQIVFMLVLVFFFVRDRRVLQRVIIRLAPTPQTRFKAARVCRVVQNKAASYLLSVCVINLVLGAATATAFFIAGMPEPLDWGAAMAVLNFVPFIGPLILQIVSLLAGLVIYPSIEAALIPPAVLIALNLIESNFGMPLVM